MITPTVSPVAPSPSLDLLREYRALVGLIQRQRLRILARRYGQNESVIRDQLITAGEIRPQHLCHACQKRFVLHGPLCRECRRDSGLCALYCPDLVRAVDESLHKPAQHDPTSCPHPPGSPGKVEALERRVALGYHLWHPQDAGHGKEIVA